MKHTPGPWSYGNGEIRVIGGNINLLDRLDPIAIVKRMDEPEQQANAALIATAPDLLEACQISHKVLKDFIEYANETNEVMVSKAMQTAFLMTGDAIAKAT